MKLSALFAMLVLVSSSVLAAPRGRVLTDGVSVAAIDASAEQPDFQRLRPAIDELRQALNGPPQSESLPAAADDCSTFAANLFCNSNLPNAYLGGSDCYSSESKMYVDFYKLTVASGQAVTLRASTSRSHTLLLTFQDYTTGDVLKSTYGQGALTLSYVPAATTLVVGVAFLEDFATGDYTLNVSCGTASEPPPAGCAPVATLSCDGGAMLGSLTATDCRLADAYYADLYRIPVTRDIPVEVTVNAEFPVYISADSPTEGAWVQGARTMTLSYTPSSTGTLSIYVSSEAERVSGGYSVSVKCPPATPCRSRAVRR